MPRARVAALAAVLVGSQMGWALQTAFATPLFLELGASRRQLGFLRLPGPVAGLLVQVSGCPQRGVRQRRRAAQPAAAADANAPSAPSRRWAPSRTSPGGAGPSWSSGRCWSPPASACSRAQREPGRASGSRCWGSGSSTSVRTRGRAPARAAGGGGLTENQGFNCTDAAVRVLAADVCPGAQQAMANATVSTCGRRAGRSGGLTDEKKKDRAEPRAGAGANRQRRRAGRGGPDTPRPDPQILGYCLSSVRFAPELHRAKVSDKAFCFALGAAAQVGALAATLALGPRPQAPPKAATGKGEGGWRWTGWRAAPGGLLALGRQERWMWQLCLVNGVGWVAWFAFFLFGTHFVAKDVFGGDPEAPEGSAARARCEWIAAPFSPLFGPTEPVGGGEEDEETDARPCQRPTDDTHTQTTRGTGGRTWG